MMNGSGHSRRRFAEVLRQLASGVLTNDQFEAKYDALSGETVIDELFQFAWSFYDDFYEHRLRGPHRLSPYQRSVFARCVLFLRSGLDYEWPARAKWLWCPQREPTLRTQAAMSWWTWLGLSPVRSAARKAREVRERSADAAIKGAGVVDDRIWPFRRRSDLRAAIGTPTLLPGSILN